MTPPKVPEPPTVSKENLDKLVEEGAIFEAFLDQTAHQLTQAGIVKLYGFMEERQLAVLFRNNHFSTIFCYQGRIYSLVTDQGYLKEDSIVWELLDIDSVCGDSQYVDGTLLQYSYLVDLLCIHHFVLILCMIPNCV